jgi:hypothetical protein
MPSNIVKVDPIEDDLQSCPKIKNHSVVDYDSKLHIFGGYEGNRNHYTIHAFDLKTKKWSKPQITSNNIPEGRTGHSATLIGNI